MMRHAVTQDHHRACCPQCMLFKSLEKQQPAQLVRQPVHAWNAIWLLHALSGPHGTIAPVDYERELRACESALQPASRLPTVRVDSKFESTPQFTARKGLDGLCSPIFNGRGRPPTYTLVSSMQPMHCLSAADLTLRSCRVQQGYMITAACCCSWICAACLGCFLGAHAQLHMRSMLGLLPWCARRTLSVQNCYFCRWSAAVQTAAKPAGLAAGSCNSISTSCNTCRYRRCIIH